MDLYSLVCAHDYNWLYIYSSAYSIYREDEQLSFLRVHGKRTMLFGPSIISLDGIKCFVRFSFECLLKLQYSSMKSNPDQSYSPKEKNPTKLPNQSIERTRELRVCLKIGGPSSKPPLKLAHFFARIFQKGFWNLSFETLDWYYLKVYKLGIQIGFSDSHLT